MKIYIYIKKKCSISFKVKKKIRKQSGQKIVYKQKNLLNLDY